MIRAICMDSMKWIFVNNGACKDPLQNDIPYLLYHFLPFRQVCHYAFHSTYLIEVFYPTSLLGHIQSLALFMISLLSRMSEFTTFVIISILMSTIQSRITLYNNCHFSPSLNLNSFFFFPDLDLFLLHLEIPLRNIHTILSQKQFWKYNCRKL